MNIIPRISLIIYLKHMKHERQIRKFGHIVSTNRQNRFVVMYINEAEADDVVNKLMKLKYVKHVEGSPYKYLKKTYEKEQHEIM
ncbi:YlbG family protein [Staphylococcus shinii]